MPLPPPPYVLYLRVMPDWLWSVLHWISFSVFMSSCAVSGCVPSSWSPCPSRVSRYFFLRPTPRPCHGPGYVHFQLLSLPLVCLLFWLVLRATLLLSLAATVAWTDRLGIVGCDALPSLHNDVGCDLSSQCVPCLGLSNLACGIVYHSFFGSPAVYMPPYGFTGLCSNDVGNPKQLTLGCSECWL